MDESKVCNPKLRYIKKEESDNSLKTDENETKEDITEQQKNITNRQNDTEKSDIDIKLEMDSDETISQNNAEILEENENKKIKTETVEAEHLSVLNLLKDQSMSEKEEESSEITTMSDYSNNSCHRNETDEEMSDDTCSDGNSKATWASDDCEKPYIAKTRALRKITSALSKLCKTDNVNKALCAEGKIKCDDVEVIVSGIGKLTFPIDANLAQKLIKLSNLAEFGHFEKTVLDRSVRDTFVISANRIEVTINNFDTLLDSIREHLKLNNNCRLLPHLHNLLIYEEGQFFDFHQDTEKMDNMVATLVISLPSPHIGGNLVIQCPGSSHTFSTQTVKADCIKYAAFYADCQHKIEKVEEGYRIVLTYNLVLESDDIEPNLPENDALCKAIKYFFDKECSSYSIFDEKEKDPSSYCNYHCEKDAEKLVYLLNHSYSKSGLKWNRLKGTDCVIAAALKKVAKKLNLALYISSVKICEKWGGYGDDPYCSGDFDMFQYFENIELKHLRHVFGNVQILDMSVSSRELCWLQGNKKLPVLKSEKDYTGNEGCSEERWYKRAAIVLWPQDKNIMFNFKLSYDEAFKELLNLTQQPNNQQAVIDLIIEARQHFKTTNATYIKGFIQIAKYLGDKGKASKILSNFLCYIFSVKYIDCFLELHNTFGEKWCLEQFGNIKNHAINTQLLEFAQQLVENKVNTNLSKMILDEHLIKVLTQHSSYYNQHNSSYYKGLIKCVLCVNNDALPKVIEHLKSSPFDFKQLADIYLDCVKDANSDTIKQLEALQNYTEEKINAEITRCKGGERKENWFLDAYLKCRAQNCDICVQLKAFMKSPTEKILELALPAAKAKHVCTVLKNVHLIQADTTKEGKSAKTKVTIRKSPEIVRKHHKYLNEVETLLRKISINIPAASKVKQECVQDSPSKKIKLEKMY